jgi:hypothetical protein
MMRFNDVVVFENDRRPQCRRFHHREFLRVGGTALIKQGCSNHTATLSLVLHGRNLRPASMMDKKLFAIKHLFRKFFVERFNVSSLIPCWQHASAVGVVTSPV